MSDPRTLSPLNLIPERIIQDLWGIGFTIIPRVATGKVYDLADGLAPQDMAYQWCSYPHPEGWQRVPASRHPGLFAPYSYQDDITINGLWLMERPKAEVDAFHAGAHQKARQNVTDWHDRVASQGFVGGVTVLQEGSGGRSSDIREIGDKTIENATKIPMELIPYVSEIFAERDRLWSDAGNWWGNSTAYEFHQYNRAAAAHPDWTRGQLMNAVLTPIAIENIRKRLEGTEHDQSTDSESTGSGTVDPASARSSSESPSE